MWNWLRQRRVMAPPPVVKDGEEARAVRRETEEALEQERRRSEQVDRLVRRTPAVWRDKFAEDLYRAFGNP